jgi:hypothetical protein
MNHPFFYRLTVLSAIILWGAGALLGQVNSAEETLKNKATNSAPAIQPAKDLPAEVKDAEADKAMGILNAQGYLALFNTLRKEAKAANRYRIPREKQQQLDQVVDKLALHFPQSYEYHYAAYLSHQYDTAMGHHLMEAYRLAPNKPELYNELVAHCELSSDEAGKVAYCKLIDQKKVYDQQLYQYSRNLFRSLEPGAFVITRGEWDTYPLWVLQHVHRIRPDVTVLQLELLHQQHYFNRMMAPFKLKKGAYQRFLSNQPAFLKELAASPKPVYLALTNDQKLISACSENLYATGLAMKISIKPFDNIPVLMANWKTFELSGLNTPTNEQELNRIHGNYILPLGLLYQKSLETGNRAEAEKLKQQMLDVAKKAGKLKEMEGYFE